MFSVYVHGDVANSNSAVIATSGIDYNIKLWEPTATDEVILHNLDEVSVTVLYRIHTYIRTYVYIDLAPYTCTYVYAFYIAYCTMYVL